MSSSNCLRLFASTVLSVCVTALMLVSSSTAFAQQVDPAAARTITAALVGRSGLSEVDTKKVEAATQLALQDEKIAGLAKRLGEARKEYVADRKKFPAERSAEIKRDYQKALDETVSAVRASIAAQNPEAAALLAGPAGSKKKPAKTRAAEYEGESALDSAAQNRLAVQPILDEPGLPRVLLIGDSGSQHLTAACAEKSRYHKTGINLIYFDHHYEFTRARSNELTLLLQIK